MQALLFNLSTLTGLALVFAGAWLTFSVAIAMLVTGLLFWATALLVLIVTSRRAPPAA